jgi:hypothetical protein
LSVALNNAFPLSRARMDRFGDLRTIDARIRGMSSIDPELRGSLFSESRRVWLLTDTINFWNSRKSAILNEATQAIDALKKLLDLAAGINGLRSEAQSAAIPIRTLLAIDAQLRLSEDALIQLDAVSASAPITAAKALLSASANSQTTLAAALAADIGRLLAERPNGGDPIPGGGRDSAARGVSLKKAIDAGRPPSIAQRVLQLEVDLPTLAAASFEDLLKIERDYYIANAWTDDVEFAVRADPTRYQGVLELFLGQLEAAPAADRTQLLIALLRASIGPKQIEDALANARAQIIANPMPRFLDLEEYAFEFMDPALKSVSAARSLPCYKWEFDDRTIPPDDGDRCKHFFLPESAGARLMRFLFRKGPKRHHVQVTVSMPNLSSKTHTFKKTLEMRDPHDHVSSLTAMQIITFAITTGTAVLAAFGAQYASAIPTDIDWGVSVTALLFGFGIDQVRDRAANS